MKCEVINRFIDKKTGELYEPGSVYECTESRFCEIEKVGKFIAKIEAPKKDSRRMAKRKDFDNE